MTAAVKVVSTRTYLHPLRPGGPGWVADTAGGCSCDIGGFDRVKARVYRLQGHALDFAREHAATHTCPSWRASGERCTTLCTDCGGRGWVA